MSPPDNQRNAGSSSGDPFIRGRIFVPISTNPVAAPRMSKESTGNLNLGVPQNGRVSANARSMNVNNGQLRFQDLMNELEKKKIRTGIHITPMIRSFRVNDGS